MITKVPRTHTQLHNGCCTSTRSRTSWLSSVPRSPFTSSACPTRCHSDQKKMESRKQQFLHLMMAKKGKELKPNTFLSYADNQAPKIISLWSATRAGKVRKTISLRSWDGLRSCEIVGEPGWQKLTAFRRGQKWPYIFLSNMYLLFRDKCAVFFLQNCKFYSSYYVILW